LAFARGWAPGPPPAKSGPAFKLAKMPKNTRF